MVCLIPYKSNIGQLELNHAHTTTLAYDTTTLAYEKYLEKRKQDQQVYRYTHKVRKMHKQSVQNKAAKCLQSVQNVYSLIFKLDK